MSSTGSTADDHAYFQAIEETFIRLRGAPLLLSPADWQLTQKWHREGIPLDVILQTLERVFAQRAERGVRGRVQGLRYCAEAVEIAWQERCELIASGTRSPAPEIDVRQRLGSLAQAIHAVPGAPRQIADQVSVLAGAPEAVEQALAALDREILEIMASRLDDAGRREIDRGIEATLAKLTARISEAEIDRVRDRLRRQAIRRRSGLPVLSLFAAAPEEHS